MSDGYSARSFHPEDLQMIAELMSTDEGRKWLAVAPWSQEAGPAMQADDPAKWQALADEAVKSLMMTGDGREWVMNTFGVEHPHGKLASQLVDLEWMQRVAHENKTMGYSPTLTQTEMLLEKDPASAELLAEHRREYGTAEPLARQLTTVPPEKREAIIQGWRADAEKRGLPFDRYLEARNSHGRKAFSPQLNPRADEEAAHQQVLQLLGEKTPRGTNAHHRAVEIARALCAPAAKEVPFGPRVTPDQRIARYLADKPEFVAWAKANGTDARALIKQYGTQHDTAATLDIAAWRGEERDARLPRLPREEFNAGKDLRRDIEKSFAAHGTTPEKVVPQRRHTVGNDRELAVRAAYAEHTGQSPEQFERDTYVPPSVAAEYEDVEVPGRASEDSGDDRRGDLARAFEQHSGG